METIEKLIELGGNEWQKNDYHRVYFNAATIAKLSGYKWDTYNTGNISSASLDGEKISNSEMNRVLNRLQFGKYWYDVPTAQFMCCAEHKSDWQATVNKLSKIIKTVEVA